MNTEPKTLSDRELSQLVYSTGVFSIWDHENGSVFWYASNLPGPFYVNTEQLIGKEVATKILDAITELLHDRSDCAMLTARIESLILSEYHQNDDYRRIVATMIKKEEKFFDGYSIIAGGERRDWFFSVPVAYEKKKAHLFLFKDHKSYLRQGSFIEEDQKNKKTLHIADLIHNASSYFRYWIPILRDHGYELIGTIAVINRGHVGMDQLKEAGVQSLALKGIDHHFFQELYEDGIISSAIYTELLEYLQSKESWAKKYILENIDFIKSSIIDEKSTARRRIFFIEDPWNIMSEVHR